MKAFVPAAGRGVTAEGLAIDDGHLDSAAATGNARVDAAFCVSARNAVGIVRGSCPSGPRIGVGAGPLLLRDGKRQPREASRADHYDGAEPRSALGLDRARRTLWMVVAASRSRAIASASPLDALTAVLQQLGATSAINLDGGGSSTLAARVDGRVRTLNRPIHTPASRGANARSPTSSGDASRRGPERTRAARYHWRFEPRSAP
ncbi:phosphodiester glycosidase family protein [Xanthomonas campestris pv. asclepiadis]|uniref:phosphodiester glycosidase family protein n=1 Tax=Xanthomonas campestris TaxID=339 RepID=UPI001E38A1F1|nr:phosphodiester glycosidase family protein [Xanthomonas campestris]MCC4617314.1 phosphodiester glycosidase family protein [Xanthomonas campestris pv. asclepiadis]